MGTVAGGSVTAPRGTALITERLEMNILDLPIGSYGVGPGGTRYKVIQDMQERVPRLGLVNVRIAEDQAGNVHKFIRGIDVEPI